MMIHLPADHTTTGTMRLNFLPVEYDTARPGLLGFRQADEIGWQYHQIAAVVPGNGSVTYVCRPAAPDQRHQDSRNLKISPNAGVGLNTKPHQGGRGRSR